MARPTAVGSPAREAQSGYALLMAMLAVALVSLATLAPLTHHQTAQQRERERQLLWVGEQYRQAIASYHAASPDRVRTYPPTLQDLLQDPRFAFPRRHLRRLYADPMTGSAVWTLIKAPGGNGIAGVASASAAMPIKRHGFSAAQAAFESAESYAEWRFVHDAAGGSGGLASPPPVALPTAPPVPDNIPPPQPPAEPVSPEARQECMRVLSAAVNACLGLAGEEALACRQRAREEMLRCVRGR